MKNGIEERNKKTEKSNGKKKEKIEIAKELLKIGMKIEQISKVTKLSEEEIEKLIGNY